jgi:hypothetical protein
MLTVTGASLVSIGVTPASPSISKGASLPFKATGTYSDGTTADLTPSVTWASSNPAVASIGAGTGVATGLAVGTTGVTATLDGVTSPADPLTVTPASLVSLAVSPANPSASVGSTVPFKAAGTYSDGTTADLTTAVTWSSSNPTVATASNSPGTQGLASALSPGTTGITATLGTTSSPADTLTVNVPDISPVIVKDNGQAGYYEYGQWSTASGGFNGNVRTTGTGTSATNAQWALQVPPGTYDFYATWTASSSNTSAASFFLYDGTSKLATVAVNQKTTPADGQYGGVTWAKLGTFTVTNGRVLFVLPATTGGNVVADGVLLASPSVPNAFAQATGSPQVAVDLALSPMQVTAAPAPTPSVTRTPVTATATYPATRPAVAANAAAVDAGLVALVDESIAEADDLLGFAALDDRSKRQS